MCKRINQSFAETSANIGRKLLYISSCISSIVCCASSIAVSNCSVDSCGSPSCLFLFLLSVSSFSLCAVFNSDTAFAKSLMRSCSMSIRGSSLSFDLLAMLIRSCAWSIFPISRLPTSFT